MFNPFNPSSLHEEEKPKQIEFMNYEEVQDSSFVTVSKCEIGRGDEVHKQDNSRDTADASGGPLLFRYWPHIERSPIRNNGLEGLD